MASAYWSEKSTIMNIDVLLICALKDEYDQVLRVRDGLLDPGWVRASDTDGWVVADGCFSTPTSRQLRIRTTWAPYKGCEHAQAVASKLIIQHPARCLAMSGICAGRRGKVALGDVIFAERLWSYDAGKTTVKDGTTKFEADVQQFNPPSNWLHRMQGFTISKDAQWLSERPALPLVSYLLYPASIASPCRNPTNCRLFASAATCSAVICDLRLADEIVGKVARVSCV